MSRFCLENLFFRVFYLVCNSSSSKRNAVVHMDQSCAPPPTCNVGTTKSISAIRAAQEIASLRAELSLHPHLKTLDLLLQWIGIGQLAVKLLADNAVTSPAIVLQTLAIQRSIFLFDEDAETFTEL